MEIVLIRHGQPEWMLNNEYTRNPGLTELGVIQAKKSADQFPKGSIDQLWVSPLNRTVQTLIPFEESEVAKEIKTCLLYTSPSPRDRYISRMPSSA